MWCEDGSRGDVGARANCIGVLTFVPVVCSSPPRRHVGAAPASAPGRPTPLHEAIGDGDEATVATPLGVGADEKERIRRDAPCMPRSSDGTRGAAGVSRPRRVARQHSLTTNPPRPPVTPSERCATRRDRLRRDQAPGPADDRRPGGRRWEQRRQGTDKAKGSEKERDYSVKEISPAPDGIPGS